MSKDAKDKTEPNDTKCAEDRKSQPDRPRVKAIFDSTKERVHGAHGIGCKN